VAKASKGAQLLIEEALRRAEDVATRVGPAELGPAVDAFVEHGITPDPDRDLSELEAELAIKREEDAWASEVGPRTNAVFMDADAIWTAVSLLQSDGAPLTPLALWELASFVDNVVAFDRIYYIAHGKQGFTDEHVNRMLDASVLHGIPETRSGVCYDAYARGAREAITEMETLRNPRSGELFGEQGREVLKAWKAIIGFKLTRASLFDTEPYAAWLLAGRPERVKGVGPPTAVPVSSPRAPQQRYRRPTKTAGPRLSALERRAVAGRKVAIGDATSFASEMTFRSYAQQRMADRLDLPYAPGTVRMPFRDYVIGRAPELDDRLFSLLEASDRLKLASRLPAAGLTLPVCLTVALGKASRPEDLWEGVGKLRKRAKRFRSHRAEIDEALGHRHASSQAQKIIEAIQSDGLELSSAMSIGHAAVPVIALSAGAAAAPGVVAVAGLVGGLITLYRVGATQKTRAAVWNRLFRRQLYFLTDVGAQARELAGSLDSLARVWELPRRPEQQNKFVEGIRAVGTLRNT